MREQRSGKASRAVSRTYGMTLGRSRGPGNYSLIRSFSENRQRYTKKDLAYLFVAPRSTNFIHSQISITIHEPAYLNACKINKICKQILITFIH